MPQVLRLQLETTTDGALLVRVGSPNRRWVEGAVPPAALERIRAAESAVASAVPVVPLAGRDRPVSVAEQGLSGALGAVLAANSAVAGAFGQALGEANGDLVLALELQEPRLRSLTWELLARAPGERALELEGQGLVARLCDGHPARTRPPAGGLHVFVWVGDEDPQLSALAARLCDTLRHAGIDHSRVPTGGLAALRVPQGTAGVLHMICHGLRELGHVGLGMGGGDREGGGLAHALGPVLSGLGLVVLDVCEGADDRVLSRDAPAGALLAAGAPAVIGPRRRVPLDVATAFAQGLYGALHRGGSLSAGVAAGRREVGAMGDPHLEGRWCGHRLFVADLDVLAQPKLVHGGWLPPGWPRPAADAAALLGAAHRQCLAAGHGVLGVAHLMAAAGEVGDAASRRIATLSAGTVPQLLGLLRGSGSLSTGVVLSPRLQGWAALLEEGFHAAQLWARMTDDPDDPVRHLLGLDLSQETMATATVGLDTLAQDPSLIAGAAPTALSVLGGSDDGWWLPLQADDWIGRHQPGMEAEVAHRLHQRAPRADVKLSRKHLRWLGDGRVFVRGWTRLRRRGMETELAAGQSHALWVGDVLLLGERTTLLARTES